MFPTSWFGATALQGLWETTLPQLPEDDDDDADFVLNLDQMLADAAWADASQHQVKKAAGKLGGCGHLIVDGAHVKQSSFLSPRLEGRT